MQEGRRLAREQKLANGEPLRAHKIRKSKKVEVNKDGKPIITITGKEKEAFDFYEYVRGAFRSLGRFTEIPAILKDITHRDFWKNPNWVINRLSKYVEIRQA
jgi:hypothetical protein